MTSHRRQYSKTRRPAPSLLKQINVNVAGIDCGSAEHYVAVPPGRDAAPVRAFKTFTSDLHRLAGWLGARPGTRRAGGCTGGCWVPPPPDLPAPRSEVLPAHV